MDSRIPDLSRTAVMFNCLYARKFKMGVGKEDRGRVGSAPILCWTTQLFGSASEQQRGSKAKKGPAH